MRNQHCRIGVRVGIAILLFIAHGPSRAVAVRFRTLDSMPLGSAGSTVLGLSGDGTTVAGFYTHGRGFAWTEAVGYHPLLVDGSHFSAAFEPSFDGSVVAGYSAVGSSELGVRWTSSGVDFLGDLPGGKVVSRGHAVSADGTTVVGYSMGSAGAEAIRWTATTGIQGLGDLSGGIYNSTAFAVSGDGSVVVGGSRSEFGDEGFVWTESAGMKRVFDLPAGIGGSFASDVSSDGTTIVGYGSRSQVLARRRAFRWTSAAGVQWLDELSPANTTSEAVAVSANGTLVGGNFAVGISFGDEAFRWTAATGMQSLKSLLSAGGVNLSGWGPLTLVDMSADGKVFVGTAENPQGAYVPWIAQIPEPQSLALAAWIGGIALKIRKGRVV